MQPTGIPPIPTLHQSQIRSPHSDPRAKVFGLNVTGFPPSSKNRPLWIYAEARRCQIAHASQFQAALFFSLYVPNRLRRRPRLTVRAAGHLPIVLKIGFGN